MFVSLFQTAAGSWHIPSILTASSWLFGSILTGIFIFSQLAANRAERINSFNKEQKHIAELENAHLKLSELEGKTKTIPALQTAINDEIKNNVEKARQIETYKLQVKELEIKTTPKPVDVRLRKLLDEISPEILIKLSQGHTGFKLHLPPNQHTLLSNMCAEKEAAPYIKILPLAPTDEAMGFGEFGTSSIRLGINIKVSPKLISKQ